MTVTTAAIYISNNRLQISGIVNVQYIIMAKKLFVALRSILTVQVQSVVREEPESEGLSSGRNSPVSGITESYLLFWKRDQILSKF